MLKKFAATQALGLVICASNVSWAQSSAYGSAAEARAMLDKVIVAMKANPAQALKDFTAKANGFGDRDLYPFCGGTDGLFSAHPSLVGKSMKELKDKEGKALGEEMYKVAAEGSVKEVAYMWPRPGADTTPVQKVSYVTKVGDQVCAVGYYK